MMSFVPITPNNHTYKQHGNLHMHQKINKITHNISNELQIGISIENHIFSYYYHWCCGFMFSLLRNPFPSLISNTINFTITIFLLLGYEHCIGYRIYVRKYQKIKIYRFMYLNFINECFYIHFILKFL